MWTAGLWVFLENMAQPQMVNKPEVRQHNSKHQQRDKVCANHNFHSFGLIHILGRGSSLSPILMQRESTVVEAPPIHSPADQREDESHYRQPHTCVDDAAGHGEQAGA